MLFLDLTSNRNEMYYIQVIVIVQVSVNFSDFRPKSDEEIPLHIR